jgi:hypothetical protein
MAARRDGAIRPAVLASGSDERQPMRLSLLPRYRGVFRRVGRRVGRAHLWNPLAADHSVEPNPPEALGAPFEVAEVAPDGRVRAPNAWLQLGLDDPSGGRNPCSHAGLRGTLRLVVRAALGHHVVLPRRAPASAPGAVESRSRLRGTGACHLAPLIVKIVLIGPIRRTGGTGVMLEG